MMAAFGLQLLLNFKGPHAKKMGGGGSKVATSEPFRHWRGEAKTGLSRGEFISNNSSSNDDSNKSNNGNHSNNSNNNNNSNSSCSLEYARTSMNLDSELF